MKKENIEIGMRVAVYNNGTRTTGEVVEVRSNGIAEIQLDHDKKLFQLYHPAQLRRLVKKKREEYWVNMCNPPCDANSYTPSHTRVSALGELKPFCNYCRIFKVRRVSEKGV